MAKTTWSFGTVGRADVNRIALVQDHMVFRKSRKAKVHPESTFPRPHGLSKKSESKIATGKEMLKTSFGTTGNDIRRLPLSEPPETMIEYYKKTLTL